MSSKHNTMPESVKELQEELKAARETIGCLKKAASKGHLESSGGMAAVRKAMANLQNSLAQRRLEIEQAVPRYQALFNYSPLICFTIDGSGCLTTLNRTAWSRFAMPGKSLLIGKPWTAFFDQAAVEQIQAKLDGKAQELRGLVLACGRAVDAIIAPVPGHQETQFLLNDVTTQRSVEERLRHSQKMDALGRLAGGVAHDFNNLLGAIIGFTELMQMKPDVQSVGQFSGEILNACSRASDLVKHLLAFSRSEPATLSEFPIHTIAENVSRIAARTFDRRIEVATDLKAEYSTICGDPSQLESALLNLVINARDAMPKGGKLTLSTRNVPPPKEIQGPEPGNGANPYIELTVQDEGDGMAPEVLAHMYDPFFTTNPQGQGTGLGLAATYGTVRRLGGTIRVQSSPGAGTSFQLFLPLRTKQAQQVEPSLPIPSRSKRVLVIDDEPAVRATTRMLLEALGHEVLVAEDGKRGLQLFYSSLETHPAELILLDLVLPDMHGNEALAQLRNQGHDVPILVISGYSPTDCGPGADGFLRKPFTRHQVAHSISEVLGTCVRPST